MFHWDDLALWIFTAVQCIRWIHWEVIKPGAEVLHGHIFQRLAVIFFSQNSDTTISLKGAELPVSFAKAQPFSLFSHFGKNVIFCSCFALDSGCQYCCTGPDLEKACAMQKEMFLWQRSERTGWNNSNNNYYYCYIKLELFIQGQDANRVKRQLLLSSSRKASI